MTNRAAESASSRAILRPAAETSSPASLCRTPYTYPERSSERGCPALLPWQTASRFIAAVLQKGNSVDSAERRSPDGHMEPPSPDESNRQPIPRGHPLAASPGAAAMITAERLRELLHYDPVTGEFRWLVSRGGIRAGSFAGCTTKVGYRLISIDGRCYRGHRLAWLYMTGEWPADEVDHVNLVRDDDRWENLREATHEENLRNYPRPRHNTSGVKGVYWNKKNRKWKAQIRVNRSRIYLGLFDSLDEAAAAYAAASAQHHGEFGRTD